jgi:putative membrane protein
VRHTARISSSFYLSSVLAIALFLTLCGCSKNTRTTSGADAQFVANTSAGGTSEVELGQLAQQRSSSDAVRNFGDKMMSDHTAAGNQLQLIAQREGLTISPEQTPEDRATYEKLSALSGPSFDRAYAVAMVQDHKQDIADFEREASQGSDLQVRRFAAETLPTLKQHLELAKKMALSVGVPAGS